MCVPPYLLAEKKPDYSLLVLASTFPPLSLAPTGDRLLIHFAFWDLPRCPVTDLKTSKPERFVSTGLFTLERKRRVSSFLLFFAFPLVRWSYVQSLLSFGSLLFLFSLVFKTFDSFSNDLCAVFRPERRLKTETQEGSARRAPSDA